MENLVIEKNILNLSKQLVYLKIKKITQQSFKSHKCKNIKLQLARLHTLKVNDKLKHFFN